MDSIFQINPVNYPFHSPTPGSITLIAGKPNINTEGLDSDFCKELSNCGFNSVAAIISASYIQDTLDACYKNGLSLFLSNANITLYTQSFINKYKDSKGLGGWVLDFNLAANDAQLWKEDAAINKEIMDKYDGKNPVFIGLTGDWNLDKGNNIIPSFTSYIADFQQSFNPSFWPYFYFPDLEPEQYSGDTEEIIENRILMYYKSLQYFAYISRYTCAPFWVSIRCQGVNNYDGLKGEKPTLNSLRGQAFTALAYGAQGIYYWNYRQSWNTGHTTFGNAPLTRDGIKTDVWSLIQTVNNEIKKFNFVFYGCEVLECRHLRLKKEKHLKLMQHAIGPLECISGLPQNLLISMLYNNGRKYIVIISDPFAKARQIITVNFSKYWSVSVVLSNILVKTLPDSKETITLEPGGYRIYTWE